MPIILQSALVSNLYFLSQLLHRKYAGNFIVDLLGKWKESEYGGGHSIPVGGIAYYITAPSSLADMAANPFHALFYLVFMLPSTTALSNLYRHPCRSPGSKLGVERLSKEAVQSVVPARITLALKGDIFYEYLSSMR
ncbi:hypothetical protein KIW84_075914 [Lathyrus oleraceus]|uniref:Uncharacterized protein n=1 Tax=Pisum sativum TaxID=3888 RepID=A0A9D5A0H2_PEA|nr:hypothetical protein KIW84_075914 [Pisum sativum]